MSQSATSPAARTVGIFQSLRAQIRKSDTYGVGQKVVAESQSKELSPVLGQITAVNGTSYSVTNGVFLESVEGKNIAGKMIVVLPFFGYLFGVVGL